MKTETDGFPKPNFKLKTINIKKVKRFSLRYQVVFFNISLILMYNTSFYPITPVGFLNLKFNHNN